MADRDNPALKTFITGLQNAHAVEKQGLEALEGNIGRTKSYPAYKAIGERHAERTKVLTDRLEAVLVEHDAKPSGFKDGILGFIGTVSAMAHVPTRDEVLKDAFAAYAFRHYEIAMYETLIVMAAEAGVENTAALRENLAEVERMAAEARPIIADVTRRTLELERA